MKEVSSFFGIGKDGHVNLQKRTPCTSNFKSEGSVPPIAFKHARESRFPVTRQRIAEFIYFQHGSQLRVFKLAVEHWRF